jgi:hypothetical protein
MKLVILLSFFLSFIPFTLYEAIVKLFLLEPVPGQAQGLFRHHLIALSLEVQSKFLRDEQIGGTYEHT